MNDLTVGYLITLLCCALDGEKAPEKPDGVDWEMLFELAKFHMVENLAYYSVERLDSRPEGELLEKWRTARDIGAVKSVNQLIERDAIAEAFTKAKIRYMPLKGWLLKEDYPQDDFRTMSDLDVLIDEKNAAKAAEVLEKLGYAFRDECDHHAAYSKPPYMNVELHTKLMSSNYERAHAYYADPWRLARKKEPYRYELKAEDNYIFLTAHFAKHYFMGGSGIRSVADIYIFLKKHGGELDRAYISAELEKMGLSEFSETAERLAGVWFGGAEGNAATQDMARYVVTSGVYGTSDRAAENRFKKVKEKYPRFARIRYFFGRAFLPLDTMRHTYPVLKKAPVLLPFCEIHRLINALIFKRDRVAKQISVMKK